MDSIQYVNNPALRTIRDGYAGTPTRNGRFMNEDGQFGAGFSAVLKWMFTPNPHKAEKKRQPFTLAVSEDHSIFKDGPDAFVWLGHSTFIIRINNKRILTDPICYDLPQIKRTFRSPFRTHEITPIDLILLSHSHRDHYDRSSFKEIVKRNPDVIVYCPLRMTPLIKREGAKNIYEAGWYQQYPKHPQLPRISFLPTKHWNRRYVHDTNRELWGAFMIESDARCMYFAGDTAYQSHFNDAAQLFPKITHAFMPIGAYKPAFMMQQSHVNPEEAVCGFDELQADKFIPMHYGTYDLSDEPMQEPLQVVQQMRNWNERLLAPLPGELKLL
jgi:L-ascorbate metabolism protein UlaG (beta-lactamase superfamily)